MIKSTLLRYLFALSGGILLMWEEIAPLIIVCILAIVFDCITAYQLSRRLKKKGLSKGKLQSHYGKRMISSFLEVFMTTVLAWATDHVVLTMVDVHLENWVVGTFCFWQGWSILENISSENDSRWATILQKVMVNKASRHYDIDITEKDLRHEN